MDSSSSISYVSTTHINFFYYSYFDSPFASNLFQEGPFNITIQPWSILDQDHDPMWVELEIVGLVQGVLVDDFRIITNKEQTYKTMEKHVKNAWKSHSVDFYMQNAIQSTQTHQLVRIPISVSCQKDIMETITLKKKNIEDIKKYER